MTKITQKDTQIAIWQGIESSLKLCIRKKINHLIGRPENSGEMGNAAFQTLQWSIVKELSSY